MKKLTYKSLLKFLISLIFFMAFFKIKEGVPFGLSLILPLFFVGFSPLSLFISFTLSALCLQTLNTALLIAVCALICTFACLLFSLKKGTPKFLASIFTLLSLIPFLATNFSLTINQKLVYSAIITLLSPIFSEAMHLLFVNKFSKKAESERVLALCVFYLFFLFGLTNLISLEFVYVISVLFTLLSCYFFKDARAFFIAILSALPILIYTKQFEALSLFTIYCAVALLFIKRSKLIASVAVIFVETIYALISGAFNSFDYPLLISCFLPFLIFLFLPKKLLDYLERGLKRFDAPLLTREIINWERAEASNKLYTLSSAFDGVYNLLSSFDLLALDEDALIKKGCDQIVFKVCENCNNYQKCLLKNRPERDDLIKLLKVGLNKGKVNLIDLSRDLSSYCHCTNSMIFEINKLLENYQENLKIKSDTNNLKNLLRAQSEGVCKVLKNLAFSFADKIKFDKKFELELIDYLNKNGIEIGQMVIVGDNVHLVLPNQNTDFCLVATLISKKIGKPMRISKKLHLDGGVLAVFTPAPQFDACFGVCQRTKRGSSVSGDTHSLTRIDANSFIAALCDGMGSGEGAFLNSQTAIDLIEALFKAGLDKDASLELTNKMLSLCSKDSFCALDLAVVDLERKRADLVKIGATFGAVISGDNVKIIENNALPLGILQEVSPTVFSLDLLDGDMIVMLSDGVTDAFFSSTETVDFLQRERCSNPQTLANKIIDFAFDKNGGVAKDDMTSVVIKIFKRI